jgi:hypothetical protein
MLWSFPHCPSETDWSINWTALEAEFDWLRSLAGGDHVRITWCG